MKGSGAILSVMISKMILGVLGLLALVSILSTIVAAVVPSGSRRRQDLGTLLAAGLISAVVVLGTLVGPLLATLAAGHATALSVVLDRKSVV